MTIIFFFLFIQFFLYFQAFNNSLLPSLLPKTMLGSSCFYRQQVDEETETFKKKPRQTCPISKSKTVLKVNNKAKFRLKHSISNSQNKIKFLFSSNFFFFFHFETASFPKIPQPLEHRAFIKTCQQLQEEQNQIQVSGFGSGYQGICFLFLHQDSIPSLTFFMQVSLV